MKNVIEIMMIYLALVRRTLNEERLKHLDK